jgi:hypothetical protein
MEEAAPRLTSVLGWQDGAYMVKLLDLFDLSELDADKNILHKLFDIFYAIREFLRSGKRVAVYC